MYTAEQVLAQEYLEARCMLIETAAILDRYDRSAAEEDGGGEMDERLANLYEALSILAAPNAAPNRAERLLNLFSDLD